MVPQSANRQTTQRNHSSLANQSAHSKEGSALDERPNHGKHSAHAQGVSNRVASKQQNSPRVVLQKSGTFDLKKAGEPGSSMVPHKQQRLNGVFVDLSSGTTSKPLEAECNMHIATMDAAF